MFSKVLFAEDLDSISVGIIQLLESLGITQIDHVKYCDDAYLKIKKALYDQSPYDLLITDLSFKADHRITTLSTGIALLEAVQKIQPDLKKVVFSIEDKSYLIKKLYNEFKISAYVPKTRNSLEELKKVIQNLSDSKIKYTIEVPSNTLIEIGQYDIRLLQLLSQGFTFPDITVLFEKELIYPSSISSLEKKTNKLKIYFKANNNVHLIAIAKDLGII